MSRWTVCLMPDCPELTQRSRCADCAREHEKQRGTRQQRGYDKSHDRTRRAAAKSVERDGFTCWRCGQHFEPGSDFDLGHDDTDRSQYRGPECRPCNRATTGR